jgi:superfamily II DNA or RNA helicase
VEGKVRAKRKIPITLLRCGNRIVVDPTTPKVRGILQPLLHYVTRKFLHGKDLHRAREHKLPPFVEEVWECYTEDHRDRLATSFGFAERITEALEARGYPVTLRYASEKEAARAAERARTVYAPCWEAIEELEKGGFKFMYRQREALELLTRFENGRISCPPAWGKGTWIMTACKLMRRAKIAVVVRNVPVLQQRLYPELAANLPSVGIVGGGKKIKGRRVMCYTIGSLHHADGDEDIVIVDEGHQACADDAAYKMGVFEHARIWMLSATWGMRLDGKDMRGEAMAGPVRLHIPYQEAVEAGVVSDLEVYWTDVVTDVNPCAEETGEVKKRLAYWAHDYRNDLIAKDARRYTNDEQVLITVETIEHALHLKKRLPEFEVVYAPQTLKPWDLKQYKRDGIVPEDFVPLDDDGRERLTRRFSKGKLRRAICTTCWNHGVNFVNLDVLIRADGGGSPVNDTQIPGRNSRLKQRGKERVQKVGKVHDYRDQFDSGCHRKAMGREERYAVNGWKQYRLTRRGLVPVVVDKGED